MLWSLSVTELNDYVRRSIAADPALRSVSLHGEISDFKAYTSGHLYFTLKDEQSRIPCICYRQYASQLQIHIENGMKVILRGAVGLYAASGTYQFYAEEISHDGKGNLYLQFEALKAKLTQEGLFDVTKKKPLPMLPRAIGVVTSRSGAVIHDIATVTRRRFPGMQLILRPARVQGDGAAEDIVKGIEELVQCGHVDLIIIGRGGGSLEDLWAFNEEAVVRAIAACPLPIVSAVGHEVDTTLSDMAADLRAATPSAAAELCVPERRQLSLIVERLRLSLLRYTQNALLSKQNLLSAFERRFISCHPATKIQHLLARTALLSQRMHGAVERAYTSRSTSLTRLSQKLHALGPRQALSRGYAVLLSGHRVITSVDQVQDEMTILLRDGRVQVHTLHTWKEDPFDSATQKL